MPGPFTHIYTARRVSEFLENAVTNDFIRPHDDPLTAAQQLDPHLGDLDPKTCGQLMQTWPKFAALGANGPDMFFFLQDYNDPSIPGDEIMLAMSLLYYLDDQGRLDDPYSGLVAILAEVNQTWAAILRFVLQLDQVWQKFLKIYHDTVGPIMEAAGKEADELTGGLFSSLGQAFSELANDLLALAAQELLSERDLFGFFSLKMRQGYDEQSFVWSDMAHYRRTSIVPARLIAHARSMRASADPVTKQHGDQLLAFALGWICHVGSDVVAHSFVNEQCGGPFRTHWQRHHLIENHVDAWNYEQTKPGGALEPDDFCGYQDSYPGLNQSAIYFAMQIPQNIDELPADKQLGDLRKPLPDGDDFTSQEQRKELLDTDGALPLWLAETIVEVLIEVYADPDEVEGPLQDVARSVQGPLGEGVRPHPRNLAGHEFQDGLQASSAVLGKILELLDVDNAGMALDDLRTQIAPAPPFTIPKGFPLPWQLQAGYRFMLSFFKRSYVSQFDMDKPQAPSVATPPFSDVTNIIRDVTGPPDFSGVNPNDDPMSQTCEALAALADWVYKTASDINQFFEDIIKSIASGATWPGREILYDNVTLPAWQLAEYIRSVLVHMAYVMPQSEEHWPNGELRKPSEIDLELITLGHTVDSAFQEALAAAADPLGNLDHDPALTTEGLRDPLTAPNPWLPVRTTKGQPPPTFSNANGDNVVEFQRPWGYPDRTNDKNSALAGNYLENPLTTAGPYPQNATPDQLLATTGTANNAARTQYEAAQCPGETDGHNNEYVQGQRTNPLGDPVVFSTYLVGQIANNPQLVSSYNLDADRGYGYLCWDWDRTQPAPGQSLPADPRGHTYLPPTSPPEGTRSEVNGWRQPGPVAVGTNPVDGQHMQLVYPGRQCAALSGTIRWATGIETHHQPGSLFTVAAYLKKPPAPGTIVPIWIKVVDGVVDDAQQTSTQFAASYRISDAPHDEALYVIVNLVAGAFTPTGAGASLFVVPDSDGPHTLSDTQAQVNGIEFTMEASQIA